MSTLQVSLNTQLMISALGPLQVRLGTEYISRFEFERVRALLVYLAVEAGSHERTWLAYLFWPDAPLKTGLQNLRQTLAALKRVLQDTQQDVPFLLATSTTIELNQKSDYSLDVSDFSRLLEKTEQHNHRRLSACSSCMSHLEQAVALYRGDFARGVSVDSEPSEEWFRHKQEQLHSQAMRALSILTDYYLRSHRFHCAIQSARRQLSLDPLSDTANHQLILALAGDNQRHAALKHSEAYKRLLETEFMLPLPDKTADLHQQLLGKTWEATMQRHSPHHNLPKPLTPFIGYEKELSVIRERLISAECRLLTLTGIAGSGKSRVAIEAAWAEIASFQDGTFYVELESAQADGVLEAIARLLLPTLDESQPLIRQLSNHLRNKEVLLVLDSFDHFIQSHTTCLSLLLHNAPQLKMLVTARERLRLQGEVSLEIRGLDYPPCSTLPCPEVFDAVRFFIHRVSQWQPGFTLETVEDKEAASQICRNVGGNPRALDLYAQVANLLPLGQIIQEFSQISDWSKLLSRDLPWCQHSLQAIFYSSWRTLTEEERRALILLVVFTDSFTLSMAEEMSDASLAVLLSLHAKSCLQVVDSSPDPLVREQSPKHLSRARYRIPELLRFYLWQTLKQEPALHKKMQRKHALYFMNLLRQNVEALFNERCQTNVLSTIRHEEGNIEQALKWATGERAHVVKAQIEHDLTLVHVHESGYRRGILDEFESGPDMLQPKWA